MHFDNCIIGTGPIGLFLGTKIKDSLIIGNQTKIGLPVQCTGIVTKDIEKVVSKNMLKSVTLNKIEETQIMGPSKTTKLKIGENFIICNRSFSEKLYDEALKNNNTILINHMFKKNINNKINVRDIKNHKNKIFKTKTLYGCDGPKSTVSKINNMMPNQKHLTGMQVTLKTNYHENIIKFYPHIGEYAWFCPESDSTARVGIAMSNANSKNIKLFKTFLKKFKGKIIDTQGGLIPLHNPLSKTTKTNKFLKIKLVGDSAGHIKNTTGGGIVPGMKACHNLVSKNKLNVKRELYLHYVAHNILKKCSNKEWDKIIESVNKNKNDFEKTDRDNLFRLAPKLILNKDITKIALKKIIVEGSRIL